MRAPHRIASAPSSRPRRRVAAALCAAGLAGTLAVGCSRGASRGEIRLADALDRLALGDSVEALQLLEQARFDRPHDHRVLFHVGRLQARDDDPAVRARGEQALRAAVSRAPDIAAYREALGLLLQVQGFHHDCMGELARAVRLDASRGRAWRAWGEELLHDWREDPTSVALRDSTLRCFENAVAADPHDADARYALACLLLFSNGAVDAARIASAPPLATGGCESRFALLQVAIECRARRFGIAGTALDRALQCLLPDDRSDWTGKHVLMHPDSATIWALLTQSQRDSLSEMFWFENDPTPATSLNERLLEHISRRVEADFLFVPQRRRKLGHSTDRGEVFLRWGPPLTSQRDVTRDARVWRWVYGPHVDAPPEFVFYDVYSNGDYVRLRREAGADFMHPEAFDVAAHRSGLDRGNPAREFCFVAARFRGDAGRVAVDLAFEAAEDSTAVAVRAAAWDGPRRRVGYAELPPGRTALVRYGARVVGRARLDVTPPARAVALQVDCPARGAARVWSATARRDLDIVGFDPDTLQMSDLLPAHVLAEGDAADPRLAVPVPRADSMVTDGQLHVYFEIYPSRAALLQRRTLEVAYRVQAMPPAWRFRDQFDAAARARSRNHTAVQSTFVLRARRLREPQRLSVDVGALEPGPYLFVAAVRDPGTGARVEREWRFTIGNGVAARDSP